MVAPIGYINWEYDGEVGGKPTSGRSGNSLEKKTDFANQTKKGYPIRLEGKEVSVVLQKQCEESSSQGSNLLGQMQLS